MLQTVTKIACALALSLLVFAGALPAKASQDEVLRDGKQEYQENCTVCHGDAGKGDGRMAEILTIKPADLTQISKRSGGTFPFWRVYGVIEGSVPVKGHAYMPDWQSRFGADESKPGYPAAYLRILTLTHYLETIQEK